ncbi:hypothetical protein AAC387_Pa04g2480 [Persea americana]
MAMISRINYICVIFTLFASLCNARNLHLHSQMKNFVTIQDNLFSINGRAFLFNGFNSYWMMVVGADPSQRYKISTVFGEAAAVGLTVCRTWAFNDGGDHALQISPGVYDEQVFQSLDFVIYQARKLGIRLILSLVNNWDDYGGRKQYVKWAQDAGVQVNNTDDFFTNSVLKGYYKNHVQKVLTRINNFTGIAYKDDPTIMAWELMNEPRCESEFTGNIVHAWVQEMAAYLKSLDSKHLLEIGLEGFYGASEPDRTKYNPDGLLYGTDFIKSNLIEEIDFTTIHAYPGVWLSNQSDEAQIAFFKEWMTSHWVDSRRTLKKPLVLAEFGKSEKDKGYDVKIRYGFMNFAYSSNYKFAKDGKAIGGALVWQILSDEMENYNDGYAIVLSEDASTSAIIEKQSVRMRDLAVLFDRLTQ